MKKIIAENEAKKKEGFLHKYTLPDNRFILSNFRM